MNNKYYWYEKRMEEDKKRKEELRKLLEETIVLLKEVQDTLQEKEVMVEYNSKVNNIYEAKTPVKGSLGQGEQ